MCGIAGIVRSERAASVDEEALRRMARALRHRGPDGYGLALLAGAGFVSTRLAIVDVEHGWQPFAASPDGPLLVFNGEVYNHVELRARLAGRGATFATRCDTEVVARALEHEGVAACDGFNGQFAIGWWEPGPRRLTLIRDRFGVRPLHWTMGSDGSIAFASEAKALLASGEVVAEPDLRGIDDVFTFWAPQAPVTPFRGVHQLRPGHVLVWEEGRIVEHRAWWQPDYAPRGTAPPPLEALLRDSVRLRLRADVPVGTYLSGGLDSSLVTALAQEASDHRLRSFSVAFRDRRYDERIHQELVATTLGTLHHVVEVGSAEIAAAFPDVVWHAETPLVRTAPVPLALLAQATRERGITVVASGEGADELYWGYDLFKEVRARLLLARDPQSPELDGLLGDLYPHLETSARRGPAWRRFFAEAGTADDPLFSHQTRFAATGIVKAFYSDDVRASLGADDALGRARAMLPADFGRWGALERAAYLEVTTLLHAYLLAAQGDRVAMAHGVECRYPFLDDRVFEHSVRTPAEGKLDGGRDKVVVRELSRRVLPGTIADRVKLPYRAPEVTPFFEGSPPAWVADRLSPSALREVGIFDAGRVEGLLRRCR
ncbi:MAG: asparagine synthase (glutamine-hydrolyzing), partial [Actinomycetota bacterium]|nr:asparagine synthase (glutamine-hydrolyzing) [Actinomycetota bacterium]